MRKLATLARLVIVYAVTTWFSCVNVSAGQVWQTDDTCNGVTGRTPSGKPCAGGSSQSTTGYTSDYNVGYAQGYNDGLSACQNSRGSGNATSNSGATGGNRDSAPCKDMTRFIKGAYKHPTGLGHCDGEETAWLTNNSSVKVYCEFNFQKNGVIDKHSGGGTYVNPGETIGGEGGGIWTCGTTPTDRFAFYCVDANSYKKYSGSCFNVAW